MTLTGTTDKMNTLLYRLVLSMKYK